MGHTLDVPESASEDHLTLIDLADEYVAEIEGPDAVVGFLEADGWMKVKDQKPGWVKKNFDQTL